MLTPSRLTYLLLVKFGAQFGGGDAGVGGDYVIFFPILTSSLRCPVYPTLGFWLLSSQ